MKIGNHQHIRSSGAILGFLLGISLITAGLGQQNPIPPLILGNLAAEKFADREAAQGQLLDWARKNPQKAYDILLKQADAAEDPEVQSRCLAALKSLVLEREYKREGYLGIQMQELEVRLPTTQEPVRALRVVAVLKNSSAEAAGIPADGMIVGLGDKVWKKGIMMGDFSATIRRTGSGKKVTLRMLIDGALVDKEVLLGDHPNQQLDPEVDDLGKIVGDAREKFFQQWLNKRRARTR